MRGRRTVALAALICSSILLAGVLAGLGRIPTDASPRAVTAGDAPRTARASGPLEVPPSDPPPIAAPSPTSVATVRVTTARITGLVVDLAGRPIAEASIVAVEEPARPDDPFADEFTTSTTSLPDGSFSLPCGASGAHAVSISAFGCATLRTDQCRAGDHLTVTLSPGAAIGGRVCTPDDGEAAAGIEVRVGETSTWTDDFGQFFIDGLEPTARTFVTTESSWCGWAGAFEAVELTAGGTTWVDLVLRDGVTVVGRVVDKRDYSPIAGAEIALGDGRVLALSDERGHYRIDGYPRSIDPTSPLCASTSGYAPEVGHPIEREASIFLLNFALGPTLTVSGRVVDTDGPVERALVRVHARRLGDRPIEVLSGTTVARPEEAFTDAGGFFHFTTVPAGAHRYVFEVQSAGHGDLLDERSLRGVGAHDVGTLILSAEALLEGVVVDELDAPLPDLVIRARPLGPSVPASVERVTRTDIDGVFRFGGLSPGRYELTGAGDGILLDRLFHDVEEAGETGTLVWVARSALEIDGLVLDAHQRPVGEVDVECTTEEGFPLVRSTRTDPHGNFRFRGLPDGVYRLRVSTPDGAQGIVRRGVVPGNGCEVVTLRPIAPVRGRVLDAEGFPHTGAYVVLLPPSGGFGIERRTTVDAQGRFAFPIEEGHGTLQLVVWPSEAAWHEAVVERGWHEDFSDPWARAQDPRAVIVRCYAGDTIEPIVLLAE